MMKTITNSIKIVFPAQSENEALARMAASGFLSVSGVPVGVIAELKTAVSEGVTNAIVHGYRNMSGNVTLELKRFASGRIKIVIRDKGVGIADIKKAMQPLYTTAPEEERAGLGFAIMESFCDKVKDRSSPGCGTAVTLEKYIADEK